MYYSQNGEDVVIEAAFSDMQSGIFVEVGCIDGKQFSNTLMLEERGWKGLCIEAHPDYIEELKANRPGSEILHCAIGESDKDKVSFYATSIGALSTLDHSLEILWKSNYGQWFEGFTLHEVPQRSLSSVFDQYGYQRIDVLSIDIEGCDHLALAGIDFARHRPELIIVEALDKERENAIQLIMSKAGYTRGPRLSSDIFWFADPARAAKVVGLNKRIKTTHFGNRAANTQTHEYELSIMT